MKKIFLLLFTASLFFMSCKDDNNSGNGDLSYDGDNFSAPALPTGTFDAGVRFPRNIVDNFIGQNLQEVDFYIQDKPAGCEIVIYGEGSGTTPGSVVYTQDVIDEVSSNTWNTHVLNTPVEIKNEDIWIAVRVIHNSETRSIGCDEGPANTNGDWMLGEGESSWKTYRDLSNQQVNINWNIRGVLSE